MGLIQKILGRGDASVEKTPVAGGYDTLEGFFPRHFDNYPHTWFQQGFTPGASQKHNPDVAAAISLYKRALMAVPARHIRRNLDGAGIVIDNSSALNDIITRPNQYMSWAEMLGVIVDGLLTRGEFACYVEEDGRGRKATIHPLHDFQMIAAEDGSIFYRLYFHDAIKHLGADWLDYTDDSKYLHIPQRHVVHGRFEVDPRNPLRALGPLSAYANSVGLGSILRAGQEAFHNNKGQPSGVLTTDATLNAEQATRLRERWNEMSQRMKQGETPILSNGLKWQSVSVSAGESQVIQLLGFTTKDIAKAFGIPPVMLGENSGVTYNNLEQLLYGWRTSGLLSVCMTIEQAFEFTFKLPKHEELILDISDLARAESMHQADTLTRLVLNGIIKPNEARARLDLAPIDGVADDLVAPAQVQPLQQNADLAKRRADREDEKVNADIEAAKNPPQPTQPKPEPEQVKQTKSATDTLEVDIGALELMLKGVFRL